MRGGKRGERGGKKREEREERGKKKREGLPCRLQKKGRAGDICI